MKRNHDPQPASRPRPWLNREEVDWLRSEAPLLPPEAHPSYGIPLRDAIESATEGFLTEPDWLEAAILAGYVPTFEAIDFAATAYIVMCCRRIEATPTNGDRLVMTLHAAAYREAAARLEEAAAELEKRFAAELQDLPRSGTRPQDARDRAAAAVARAADARFDARAMEQAHDSS
jgi:hypothetical protein